MTGSTLVRLGTAAGEAGLDVPDEIRALKQLARHYVPARYADAHGAGSAADHHDAEDSQQAVAEARAVVRRLGLGLARCVIRSPNAGGNRRP